MKLILLGAAALTLTIAAPDRAGAAQAQPAKAPGKTKCADATWTAATANVCAGHGGVDAKWRAMNKPTRSAPKGAVDSGSVATNLNSDNVPAAKPRNR